MKTRKKRRKNKKKKKMRRRTQKTQTGIAEQIPKKLRTSLQTSKRNRVMMMPRMTAPNADRESGRVRPKQLRRRLLVS
jgi:hypothetical protein